MRILEESRRKRKMHALLEYDEVIEVHLISGQYDLVAVLEIDLHGKAIFTSVQELAQKSIERIRDLSGVRDTNTIVPFFSVTKRAE
jgi:DNA-binding Lrp family transcriptional regulator